MDGALEMGLIDVSRGFRSIPLKPSPYVYGRRISIRGATALNI